MYVAVAIRCAAARMTDSIVPEPDWWGDTRIMLDDRGRSMTQLVFRCHCSGRRSRGRGVRAGAGCDLDHVIRMSLLYKWTGLRPCARQCDHLLILGFDRPCEGRHIEERCRRTIGLKHRPDRAPIRVGPLRAELLELRNLRDRQ